MERIIVENKDVYKVILKAVKPGKNVFGKLLSSTVSAEEASRVTSLYFNKIALTDLDSYQSSLL